MNKKFVPYKISAAAMANLSIIPGQTIYTTDTAKIYYDLNENTRLEMYGEPPVINYEYDLSYKVLKDQLNWIQINTIEADESNNGLWLTKTFNTIGGKNITDLDIKTLSSNMTNFYCLFNNFTNLRNIANFNTKKAIDVSYLFSNCLNLTDMPNLYLNNCKNTQCMFNSCCSIPQEIPVLNLSNVNDACNMFFGCYNLIGDIPAFKLNNCTNSKGMFYHCYRLNGIISNLNLSNCLSTCSMFYYCNNLTGSIPNFDLGNCINTSYMFISCNNLTGGIPDFNLSNRIVNMKSMFHDCKRLTKGINININSMTNLKDGSAIFAGCRNLTGNIPNWHFTDNVNIFSIFAGCRNLTGNIPNWNVTNCSNITAIFSECHNLTGSIPSFDLGKITHTTAMFYNCSNLTGNIPNFDLGNCINMCAMFYNCSNLIGSIPNFDLSNCIDISNYSIVAPSTYSSMGSAFAGCSNLTGTIPTFNSTSKIKCMANLFFNCTNLEDFIFLDMSNVTNIIGMFYLCNKIMNNPNALINIANAFPLASQIISPADHNIGKIFGSGNMMLTDEAKQIFIDKGYVI